MTDVPQGLPLGGVRECERENDRAVPVYTVDSLSKRIGGKGKGIGSQDQM